MDKSKDPRKRKPCVACIYRRQRCPQDCVLAPYFPSDRPDDFLNAHKVFGQGKLVQLIRQLPLSHRELAMDHIKKEANIRVSDPSGGCYRIMCQLSTQIYYTKLERDHILGLIASYRGRVMSTDDFHDQGFVNVDLEGTPSNLQDFMHVPLNPVFNQGQEVHPLNLYNANVTDSWPSTLGQNKNVYNASVNDARFSSILQPFQNQPNSFFSLAESVPHGNASERIVSTFNQTFNPSSSQPIQNQPVVRLYSPRVSEHNNEDDDIHLLDFFK